MSKLRIKDAPLLPNVNGTEKIPTGGRGDYSVSLEQVKTFARGGIPQQLEDHINDLENPHNVTKSQVGLGNADNTSDVDKPISTATQEALDLKADKTAVYSKSATLPTYYTKEVGVHTVIGVAEGAYFNVRSTDDNTMLDEYQNVGGVATPTGKSYPSGAALTEVKEAIIDPDTGNAVASKVFDASGKTQQAINDYHPSVKTSPSLQSALTAQDTQKLSSNFFPSQKGNYQVTETLVLQEPTMIYGDRGATYNRGGGKQGNIELTAEVGFDLGNYRTYQAGLTTPDLVNKKSGNPADQWTVKNLSFVQATGQALTVFGFKYLAHEYTRRSRKLKRLERMKGVEK